MMRLFVSIDPPAQIRSELAKWVPDNPGIRKTAPGNIHLTLLFLGEQTKQQAGEISKRLESVRFEPFEITIRKLGAFPDKSSPSVIWAGAAKNPELLRLQQKMADQLSQFTKAHNQPFRPHFTLARVSDPAALSGADIFSAAPDPLTFKVPGFSLKRSVLGSSGAVHEIWKRFP